MSQASGVVASASAPVTACPSSANSAANSARPSRSWSSLRRASSVARARLTPPRTSAIRSRMDVRTVASPMSSPAITSVTVRSPSVSSSSRAATGAACATVASSPASATSPPISSWCPANASSRPRNATARCPNAPSSASASPATSSIRAVSAYRISFSVSTCPCARRSSVSPATHPAASRGASPRSRRTSPVSRSKAPARASAAWSVSVLTVSNSARTCSAVPRTSSNGPPRAPSSASPSQWYESAARTHAPTSASYTSAVGSIPATAPARDRQSEIPRTRSALPTLNSGPEPTS